MLAALRPGRLGEVGLASLVALITPLAAAVAWGDIAGGLLLIAVGALLGAGAGAGSPRRDTAVLAQIAGLVGLLTGVVQGKMFGAAGRAWFGTGWGLGGGGDPTTVADIAPQVAGVLGIASGLLALYALCVFLRARSQGQTGRGRQVLGLVFSGTAAFGLAAAACHPAFGLLALGAAISFGYARGVRAVFMQLGLDLVGVLRLGAVAVAAVVVAEMTFAMWISPDLAACLLAPISLGVACLALVADPAYVAMGVPYDVSLGGRELTHPFSPFRRTLRGEGGTP